MKRAMIVAEISANHGGSFNRAVKLIIKAKECGADAVKFQTYTPDCLTINSRSKYFKIKHPKWGGQTLYDLYKGAYAPWNWFKKLKKVADNEGIIFFSAAFSKEGFDFVESLGVPFHKIASFEILDLELVGYAASKKKPLVISTGMASIAEIKNAVFAARKKGAKEVTLLKCTSSYPAKYDEMNLKTIPDMVKRFNCPVGISDHSLGITVPLAAVSVGASMVEKHFILSRKNKSPDNFFSIEPRELKEMAVKIRDVESALGKVHYGLTNEEKKNLVFRRSLFAVRDINKGEKFTKDNIRSIRPADGLKPRELSKVLGKKAKSKIKIGTPLKWNFISK